MTIRAIHLFVPFVTLSVASVAVGIKSRMRTNTTNYTNLAAAKDSDFTGTFIFVSPRLCDFLVNQWNAKAQRRKGAKPLRPASFKKSQNQSELGKFPILMDSVVFNLCVSAPLRLCVSSDIPGKFDRAAMTATMVTEEGDCDDE
ncbi:MAG: hypothetical protein J7J06_03100 [Methanosarcinales archaeon]|nr:hypothetical protein [Methanosarcinales archaeon]